MGSEKTLKVVEYNLESLSRIRQKRDELICAVLDVTSFLESVLREIGLRN